MKELLERDAVLDCFHDWVDKYGDVHTADEMTEYQAIEALPVIEPKTGKWIHITDGWECSGCRCLVEEENKPPYNFCPQCGTYMRGDET